MATVDYVKKSEKFSKLTKEERIDIINSNPITPLLESGEMLLASEAPIQEDKPYVVGGNTNTSVNDVSPTHKQWWLDCSGQLKLATVLEFSQYSRSDSLGVRPPLY